LDFLETLRILGKQRRVVVPCLMLTLLLTVLIAGGVEPTYKTTGSALLFFPNQVEDPEAGGDTNPYLSFGNLTVIGDVITEVLNQTDTRGRLAAEGGVASFEIGLDPTTATPLITVVATGRESDVIRTVDVVIESIGEELARLQEEAGAPPATWITAQPVTAPEPPQPQFGSRIRVGAVVMGLGVAATVSFAFAANALEQRGTTIRLKPTATQLLERLRLLVRRRAVPSAVDDEDGFWAGTVEIAELPSTEGGAPVSCEVCADELADELAYQEHLAAAHPPVPPSPPTREPSGRPTPRTTKPKGRPIPSPRRNAPSRGPSNPPA
jgi:hypothetical protein